MADVNATFNYDADFGSALSQIKALSKELSVLNTSFNSLDKNARVLRNDLANTFTSAAGQIGGFSSKTVTITSDLDNFGKSLDKSKLKLRDYYREATRAFTANSNARKLAEDQVRRTKGQLVELGMDAEGRRKGILVTPLKLDMTDMNNQLQVARKQFDIFNRLIQDGATSLINWGKNTQWAGRQLTVGLTVPMTIFASTTIKAFNDVDRELTRFQKVYGSDLVGTTTEATNAIRQQIQSLAIDIAKQYGIAAKETAGLAADLAATGLEGKRLTDSIKETTRLAVLGELDRQDAMATTLSLQNAFNMSTQELAESIDFLNAVENQTSVSLQDLTVAIPKVGPVVESLGGDVKDLSVLLVAMKEGGINAAEGANALKSGLASLINPTKSASAIAKQYGIDLQGIVTRNKGQLMPTLLEFQASLQTLDDFGKAKIIEQLFGKYQFARISALFDNLNAQGSQTVEVMKLMGASSADLAKIADAEIKTLTESTSMRFQRAMEGIKASLLPVGETITRAVIPFMEKFAEIMGRIVDIGKGLPEPVKNFLKFATGLTAVAGPLVMITGVLANFLGYVTKGAMGFVNLGRRLAGLPTNQFALLDDNQIAAAKATDMLTVSIQNQASAMTRLVQLMRDYNSTLIAQKSATPGAFTSTPLVNPPRRGGKPPTGTPIRRQQGSWVPGSGSGDKVKALLEPGEFIVNRNAAKQYGGFLEDINNGTPRFQSGGRIKGYDDGGPFKKVSGPGAFGYEQFMPQEGAPRQSSESSQRVSKTGLDLSHIISQTELKKELLKLGIDIGDSTVQTVGFEGLASRTDANVNRAANYLRSSSEAGTNKIPISVRPELARILGVSESSLLGPKGSLTKILERGFPISGKEYDAFVTLLKSRQDTGTNRAALSALESIGRSGLRDHVINGIPNSSPINETLRKIISESESMEDVEKRYVPLVAKALAEGQIQGHLLPPGSASNRGKKGPKQVVQYRRPGVEVFADRFNALFKGRRKQAGGPIRAMGGMKVPASKVLAEYTSGGMKNVRRDLFKYQELTNQASPIPSGVRLGRGTVLNPGLSKELPADQQKMLLSAIQSGDYSSIIGKELNFRGLSSFSENSIGEKYSTRNSYPISRFMENALAPYSALSQSGALAKSVSKDLKVGPEGYSGAFFDFTTGKNTKGINTGVTGINEMQETILSSASGRIVGVSTDMATKKPIFHIEGYQSGGSAFVPGSGEGDRVPALLEPGEFVVNKKAAKKYGGMLEDINFNQAPRFQSGGMSQKQRVSAGTGAIGMMTMMLPALSPTNEALGNFANKVSTAMFAVSALTGVMDMFGKKLNAQSMSGLLERGAAKRSVGQQGLRVGARMGGMRGAGIAAQGVGRLAMGALMSGPGIAVAAVIAGAAFAWAKYKKEVEEARKATEQAFSVGEKTAKAYGYELTKISDKLKENAELTKQIGINSNSVTSSIIVDEEKKAAILEDNAQLLADLKEKEKRIAGDQVFVGYDRENNNAPIFENSQKSTAAAGQVKSQLLTKYATLRQQGVSVEDANEIIRVIAMEAGDETISALLDLKPTLEKMNGDNINQVFKAAQEAQLAGLKNIDTGSVGGGEAFREGLIASMDVIQYAPPEDQLDALNNLITNMRGFDSDQLVLASQALAEAAAANYGTKSGIGQALQTLFKSGDVDQIALGTQIDDLLKTDSLTQNQILEIELAVAEGSVDKVNSIVNPLLKDRDLRINVSVQTQKDAQKRIEEINKEIAVQQAKFDGQMIANDNAVEAENNRYENAQKAHEAFIKQKQKEIEAINKSADAYIKALQDEQRADDFAQQQRDTALGGLKSLSGGDVFGFVQSQQEMAGAAQQFGFESEIKAIDERRQAAVDAKQEEIEKQQELAATEDERHQNRLKALEAQRVAQIKANGDIMKGFQGQQAALEQLSTNSGAAYNSVVEGFAKVDVEANKVAATAAAVNYLLANPKATVEEAIAAGRKFMESKAQNPGERFTSVGGSYESGNKMGANSPKYASGGYISGAGGPKADLIPARLSNGEYVVQASAVNQYGVGMMDAINEQKFATGGLVTFRGKKFDQSTVDKLLLTEKDLDKEFSFYQGSYNKGGVKASAGTHDGGGVFDVKTPLTSTAVSALRKRGFAAWMRSKNIGGVQHIHALEIGNPNLSPAAAGQVKDFLAGGDGLKGGSRGGSGGGQTDDNVQSSSDSLDQIATAMGTTAEIYNKVKNEGIMSLVGRRFGGSMTMNKPYMVGENGPEVVMPYGSGGRVVPIKYNVPAMASGGIMNGSMVSSSPQINVTVNGVNDPKQAADRAAQLINSEMNRRKFSRSIV